MKISIVAVAILVIFKIIAAVVLESENILAIEMGKCFIEAATERCSSNMCWVAIIKIILLVKE